MVTKRVHKRQMLLIGDDHVNQVVLYTLAYSMQDRGMALHSMVTEGNHIHRTDTDAKAVRPAVNQKFHSLVAKQLNRHYGESDAFFSNKQTNIVHNENENDVLDRIVYTMGNPVADGIEREGKNHKGIRMRWPQPDMVIKRPKGFFRTKEQGGKTPDEIVLRFTRPPGFHGLTDEELDELIEKRVLAYEAEKRAERDAKGLGFRCDRTDALPDPRSYPKTPHKLFRLAPLIGAKIKEQRLAAIERLRTFRAAHEVARLRKKAGEHDVVFPHGTYLAAVRWNVLVEPAPT